jgi:hypothetical protein
LQCVAWLNEYFSQYGDQQPNERTVYISEKLKVDCYEQYCNAIVITEPVSRDDFYNIWKNCFPYIRLRKDCNIIGKCNKCAKISQLRSSSNAISKITGKELHTLHRVLFQNERLRYEERVFHAMSEPNEIASFGIDIMDSYSLKTPNTGSQAKFPKTFESVIVGVITHGSNKLPDRAHQKSMRLFRTWATVKKTQNLIVHCFLRSLEEWIVNHKGKNPSLIYLQVDGGSENANRTLLCHLQHCVTLKLCNKIVYTRLPTGHGHIQDIDGGFGLVKSVIGGKNMAGLKDFEEAVTKKLGNSALHMQLENVYLINDWETYYEPYYSKVERLYKLDQTVHQILFDTVSMNIDYPWNSKVFYRAYASLNVIELIDCNPLLAETDLGSKSGLEPVKLSISWYDRDEEGNPVSFLGECPKLEGVPLLLPVADCVAEINEVMEEISNTMNPSITSEMKKEYISWRKKYLPSVSEASALSNLDTYAKRLQFSTPFFHLFEGITKFQSTQKVIEPNIVKLNDEKRNEEIKILKGLTQPTIRTDRPITRAFVPFSTIATTIQKSIVDTELFKSFQIYLKVLFTKKKLSKFLQRYIQCSRSLHGLLKMKKWTLKSAPKSLIESLSSFLYTFYTPLLDSYKESVTEIIDQHHEVMISEIVSETGTKIKIKVKDIKPFNLRTINILMLLFNLREKSIYDTYSGDIISDDDDDAFDQVEQQESPYLRIKFEYVEKVVSIFNNNSQKEMLPSSKKYSKIIYPYRYEVFYDNKIHYPVALIIIDLSENILMYLDPYLSPSQQITILNDCKMKFDAHFDCNFTIKLYNTIEDDNADLQDCYEKLKLTSTEEPIIYMYVMIYYIIYSCPIIFKAEYLKEFHYKIIYMILKKTLII